MRLKVNMIAVTRFFVVLLLAGACVAPSLGQQREKAAPTPLERATEMKKQRATAGEVAIELQHTFRQSDDQVADILHVAGFPSTEVARALVTDIRMDGAKATSSMLDGGFEPPEVLSALVRADVSLEAVVASFRKISLFAQQSADALKATGSSPTEAAAVLKNAGYSVEEVASAIQGSYGLAQGELVSVLVAVEYGFHDVFAGLKNVGMTIEAALAAMKQAGYTAGDVMPDAIVVYNLTVDATLILLQDIWQLNIEQVATLVQLLHDLTKGALVDAFLRAGVAAPVVAETLLAVGYSVAEILDAFVAVGTDRIDEIVGLLSAMDATLQTATAELKRLAFAMNEIGAALVEQYGPAVIPLATALYIASFTANEAVLVLQAGGFVAMDIAQALVHAGFTVTAVGAAFAAAGYTFVATATAFKEAGYELIALAESLDAAFTDSFADLSQALKDAGYEVEDIARAQKDAWERTPAQGASLLAEIGYNADANARTQKDIWNQSANNGAKNMGDDYTARQHAAVQRTVWARSRNQTAATLKDELGINAEDNADALRRAYKASDADVAGSLNAAGYSYDQIQNALVGAFNMSVTAAVALLGQLGISG